MSIFAPAESYVPERTTNPYTLPAKPVSAGRAWIFSVLLPGAGQMYLEARQRGAMTMTTFVVALAAGIFAEGDLRWIGIRFAIFVYAFAGLDAYFTAREVNHGVDPDAAASPRVAAVLNLTTNGFGYVYLGEKSGLALVVGLTIVNRVALATLPLLAETVSAGIAIHAYQKATQQREEIYPKAMRPQIASSQLPPAVPVAFAGLIVGVYYALGTIGQIALLIRK